MENQNVCRSEVDPQVTKVKVMDDETARQAVLDQVARDRAAFQEAIRVPEGAIMLGASNMPYDPEIWSPDWRTRLPNGHPVKEEARMNGLLGQEQSCEAAEFMHSVLVGAANRLSSRHR